MAEQYIFWPTAVLALTSAMMMVLARSAVHSALLLVLNFFSLAVLYVLLEAPFLAAIQIIVYAGAIMVLFLFVIMLIGVAPEEELNDRIPWQRPVALLAGAGLGALLVSVVRTAFTGATFAGLSEANAAGNVEGIGRVLFSRWVFPFEVAGVLLLVAAIGITLIGRKRLPGDDDELVQPDHEEERS